MSVDPTELDHWDAVDTVCPYTITVQVAGGEPQDLRCEEDVGHSPPCTVSLFWTPEGEL